MSYAFHANRRRKPEPDVRGCAPRKALTDTSVLINTEVFSGPRRKTVTPGLETSPLLH
jgi:hypothetical protein